MTNPRNDLEFERLDTSPYEPARWCLQHAIHTGILPPLGAWTPQSNILILLHQAADKSRTRVRAYHCLSEAGVSQLLKRTTGRSVWCLCHPAVLAIR